MSAVSAVVVTWNSSRDIEACLTSLQEQTHPIERMIVLDNASTDGTPDFIESRFPKVVLLRQDVNLGFARGNNLAIEQTASDWVLTLNPDAWLAPDWIERLLDFANERPDLGMIGGKLLRATKTSEPVLDSVGIEIFRSRRVRDRGLGEVDTGQYEQSCRVFGICAAAALYRRQMLEDTALEGEFFPERFFAYYEDADLAWRAWRRGWTAWYLPKAKGWHQRGGSPTGSRFSRELTHRNRLWMIARNEPLRALLPDWQELTRHELLMMLRILRYPYLLKATWQSARGWSQAIRDRIKLTSTNQKAPPFQSGIGFFDK